MATQVIVKNPKMYALVLMIGGFMGLFSETALNMALTDIMADFQVSAATVQWLTTGYLLVMACLVPASSYLIKWFSTKSLVITGILLSLLGVIVGALAPNFGLLLLGRIIQALGTGILLPIMVTVLMLIFPIEKRGAVMGIMGLVITAGPALGPTLSGVIISASSWHFIFWISAILYIVVLLMAFSHVENVGEITKPRIDIISIFLSTISFAGLIFALSSMAEAAFTDVIVWLPLFIGVIGLAIFIVRQFKIDSPMLNLNVFKYPMFILGAAMVFITILCILSTGILLPLYLKGALLFSSVVAGLILLPGNAVNLVLSPVIGSLFDRFGARYFGIIGFVLMFIAAISFAFMISASTPVWAIILAFMVLFCGISMVMMPAQTNALNQLPHHLYADGSATITTLIQVGGSAGTAIAITIYTTAMKAFGSANPNAAQEVVLAHGIQYTFFFIVGLTIIGFILSLFVKKTKTI
ncbi:DHA2 family efflux MFS transporter permease subunit [Staphylococcus equorum]|uniref:DHA2 family efflux MFS transporter permease subunit n=1 Tax=Staphylococcus equorum TaxID=246432 RepID=UPI001F1CB037|nr:DHA2 family efflux MFS transporter permease subunit [Staphylococcus equorum]MCE5007646.1 DHA2 family efflux MFS transporter permease subunit [Staphylococcus equorum]MEB7722011.1 DHA2 family efflux MFS transporter permease subunit [Staphylococcus equorum]